MSVEQQIEAAAKMLLAVFAHEIAALAPLLKLE